MHWLRQSNFLSHTQAHANQISKAVTHGAGGRRGWTQLSSSSRSGTDRYPPTLIFHLTFSPSQFTRLGDDIVELGFRRTKGRLWKKLLQRNRLSFWALLVMQQVGPFPAGRIGRVFYCSQPRPHSPPREGNENFRSQDTYSSWHNVSDHQAQGFLCLFVLGFYSMALHLGWNMQPTTPASNHNHPCYSSPGARASLTRQSSKWGDFPGGSPWPLLGVNGLRLFLVTYYSRSTNV